MSEEITKIKQIYNDMIEVAKVNHPDIYMMPIAFYNRIMETMQQLNADLKRVKKSRDKYKEELKELKK